MCIYREDVPLCGYLPIFVSRFLPLLTRHFLQTWEWGYVPRYPQTDWNVHDCCVTSYPNTIIWISCWNHSLALRQAKTMHYAQFTLSICIQTIHSLEFHQIPQPYSRCVMVVYITLLRSFKSFESPSLGQMHNKLYTRVTWYCRSNVLSCITN